MEDNEYTSVEFQYPLSLKSYNGSMTESEAQELSKLDIRALIGALHSAHMLDTPEALKEAEGVADAIYSEWQERGALPFFFGRIVSQITIMMEEAAWNESKSFTDKLLETA